MKRIYYREKRNRYFKEQEEMGAENEEKLLSAEKSVRINQALKGILAVIDSEISEMLNNISSKVSENIEQLEDQEIKELVEEVVKEELMNLIFRKLDEYTFIQSLAERGEENEEIGESENIEGENTSLTDIELELGEEEEGGEGEEGTEEGTGEEGETIEQEELNAPEEEEVEEGLEL